MAKQSAALSKKLYKTKHEETHARLLLDGDQRLVMRTYSRAIGTSPYHYVYESLAVANRYVYESLAVSNHGLLSPSAVPLKSTDEDLIQAFSKDLADLHCSYESKQAFTVWPFPVNTRSQQSTTTLGTHPP